MLDEPTFGKIFKEITEYYRHDVSPFVTKIYYEYISENLDESEFMEATQLAMRDHPVGMKLPSPVQIVELIRGTKESKAYEQWQIILKAASANDVDQLTYLSTRGHIALSAIGGINAVAYHEGSLVWLQKDFVTVYCQCSDKDVHILKPTRVENPLPNYIADLGEDQITPEQLAEMRCRIKGIGH